MTKLFKSKKKNKQFNKVFNILNKKKILFSLKVNKYKKLKSKSYKLHLFSKAS